MLVNTIEDNYKLPIDDIVCVDLYAFRDVLDALDGVEMESTEEYAMQMNIILAAGQNALFGADDVIDIRENGIYHLNGNEALSYVRLRHVGDWSDIQRTERQRAFPPLPGAFRLRGYTCSVTLDIFGTVCYDKTK